MQHAQLWKRILNEGVTCITYTPGESFDEDQAQRRIVTSRIIVCGSPVDAEDEDLSFKSIIGTPVALPFDDFWIEFPKVNDWLAGSYVRVFPAVGGKPQREPSPESDGWALMVRNVLAIDGRRPLARPPAVVIMDRDCRVTRVVAPPDPDADLVDRQAFLPDTHSLLQCRFMLAGLLLLSCKNVNLAPHANDPQQVRRAVKRHGGTPDSYRYHTLIVRPAGARSDAPARDIGIMPFHLCRGHFAEYGPDFGKGLLFGQHAGRFYIPPHVKGDKKNGTVEKDYEVRATPAPGPQLQPQQVTP